MAIEKSNVQEISIPFNHVSDTAYLVAAYRLLESYREDRHFNDHLAAKLLGSKREEILSRLDIWKLGAWTMTIRTNLIDRILLKWVGQGIDTVVNLAAGLDTRPYRLPLPPTLNWIEADFAGVIQYKDKMLEDELPNCNLKRIGIDLTNQAEKEKFFLSLKDIGRFVVLTEGLLMYLSADEVQSLSRDLSSQENLYAWITDIMSQNSLNATMLNSALAAIDEINNEGNKVFFKFLPSDGIHYFESLNWHVQKYISFYEHGNELKITIPVEFQSLEPSVFAEMGIGVLTNQNVRGNL